ncbi:MAG: hypothetical protein COA79_20170 [Planctomycetota bacterium]|nr:MAG: hypothetical protein COA79_20170 [Planctomycetota bacterium]
MIQQTLALNPQQIEIFKAYVLRLLLRDYPVMYKIGEMGAKSGIARVYLYTHPPREYALTYALGGYIQNFHVFARSHIDAETSFPDNYLEDAKVTEEIAGLRGNYPLKFTIVEQDGRLLDTETDIGDGRNDPGADLAILCHARRIVSRVDNKGKSHVTAIEVLDDGIKEYYSRFKAIATNKL